MYNESVTSLRGSLGSEIEWERAEKSETPPYHDTTLPLSFSNSYERRITRIYSTFILLHRHIISPPLFPFFPFLLFLFIIHFYLSSQFYQKIYINLSSTLPSLRPFHFHPTQSPPLPFSLCHTLSQQILLSLTWLLFTNANPRDDGQRRLVQSGHERRLDSRRVSHTAKTRRYH